MVASAFNGTVPPIQALVNAGKSRIWGIEVDAAVSPFDGLQIDVDYSYLKHQVAIDQRADAADLPHLGGAHRASRKVAVAFTQEPRHGDGNLHLALAPQHRQHVDRGTFTHTDSNPAVAPIDAPFLYKIKASNLLNINVDWRSIFGTPFDAAFFMTNVTNEQIVTFPGGSWQTFGADAGHLNLPRMFGWRLRYHFGT